MLDMHFQVVDEDGDRDEAATNAYLDALLQAFAQAPEGQEILKTDPYCGQWAVMFLRYYFDYLGGSIADITMRDVGEVLFELMPKKVSVEAERAPEIMAELRAFWVFLGRECGLRQAREIGALLDDRGTLKLKNLLADPRNWGMAKSFVMAGKEAGFDMTTQEGNEAFQAVYNATLAHLAAAPMPTSVSRVREEQRTAARTKGQLPGLTPITVGSRVGRNDPCPCGSGKKFKKCCARR